MMVQHIQKISEHIRKQLHQIIVGQDEVIDQILIGLFAEGHILIEGVPGTAKTLIVKTLSRIIGANFNRIQFTPDLMPSDITGTHIFNLHSGTFTLRQGPIFTDLLLADEINRTPPKTQAALLEAMEERQATIDGESHLLSPLFMVFATQNPIEYEGTYPLPEAQLDRFLLKILISYPSLEEECKVISNWNLGFNTRRLQEISIVPISDIATIAECRANVRAVEAEEGVQKYIVNIVRSTRECMSLSWGAGPRAAVALLMSAKAQAAMHGKEFITPDDVKAIVKPVLRHRIVLRADAEIEGITPDQVIDEIVANVEVPR